MAYSFLPYSLVNNSITPPNDNNQFFLPYSLVSKLNGLWGKCKRSGKITPPNDKNQMINF